MGAEGIRPLGEHEIEEPEGRRPPVKSNAERIAHEAERFRG
jgi:hypothetical protein